MLSFTVSCLNSLTVQWTFLSGGGVLLLVIGYLNRLLLGILFDLTTPQVEKYAALHT